MPSADRFKHQCLLFWSPMEDFHLCQVWSILIFATCYFDPLRVLISAWCGAFWILPLLVLNSVFWNPPHYFDFSRGIFHLYQVRSIKLQHLLFWFPTENFHFRQVWHVLNSNNSTLISPQSFHLCLVWSVWISPPTSLSSERRFFIFAKCRAFWIPPTATLVSLWIFFISAEFLISPPSFGISYRGFWIFVWWFVISDPAISNSMLPEARS